MNKRIKVYIVFEESTLMEVFDNKRKANKYVSEKIREWETESAGNPWYRFPPEYEIIMRELL